MLSKDMAGCSCWVSDCWSRRASTVGLGVECELAGIRSCRIIWESLANVGGV